MNAQTAVYQTELTHWSAIFSLFMGVTSLIAAEFIPVSLLTAIAHDLSITEGMAGQSVTVVGIFSVLSSLLLSPMTKDINRKYILLALSLLLVIANLLAGMAPNYAVLLTARAILGICVGGFWSLAPAITLQLAPPSMLPRALSIIYAGVSVATILSLPLASYFGHLLGWRAVFFITSILGIIMFVWQYLSMPNLPALPGSNFKSMINLLKKKWVLTGMGGIIFSYGGYHVLFTYLKPFLEHSLLLQPNALAVTLLAFGIANCLGTFSAGIVLEKWFKLTLPTVLSAFVCTALLLFLNVNTLFNIIFIMIWGFLFGFIPVSWSAWIAHTLADKAELAGGISVAVTQFSMGLVAAVGGVTFDNVGIRGNFIIAALFLALAFILVKANFSLYAKDTEKFL